MRGLNSGAIARDLFDAESLNGSICGRHREHHMWRGSLVAFGVEPKSGGTWGADFAMARECLEL